MARLKMLSLLLCCSAVMTCSAAAKDSPSEVLYSLAKTKGGKTAYAEEHNIRLNSTGAPESALTKYFGPDQTLMATLATDFKNGLAAPDYVFTDERDGSSHGVVVNPDGFVVWKKAKNEERKEKFFKKDEFNDQELVVSGQGLFFYLRSHLKEFSKGKSIPIKLLVPGRLDYFSFNLRVEEEDANVLIFKMRSDSILIRIFLASLEFKFDKLSGRIIQYVGPSNLVDNRGSVQDVAITYSRDVASLMEK